MNTRTHFIIALTVVGAAAFLTPATSFAWDGHRDSSPRQFSQNRDHHSDYRFGERVRAVPRGSFSIRIGDVRFYYNNGRYYRPYNREYVLVRPPYGARIHRIPSHYRRAFINGVWYHTDNVVYYTNTPYGYQVVPAPVIVQAPPQVVVATPTVVNAPTQATGVTTTADDTFYTVNIPNERAGGYTPVTLKRLDNGFVGPQGEFYAEFPRVTQLKEMYVK